MHNNFINVCEPVVIGNDVGLSEEVSIITHGYWQSVLDGYPRKFAGVTIGNGVIVGYRSTILPGVEIGDNCVVGACSVVTKSLVKGIYGGNPAKLIGKIKPMNKNIKTLTVLQMLYDYGILCAHDGLNPEIEFLVPMKAMVDDFTVDLLTFEYSGTETAQTDHFRDYLRKWGIRIYTKRPF